MNQQRETLLLTGETSIPALLLSLKGVLSIMPASCSVGKTQFQLLIKEILETRLGIMENKRSCTFISFP